MKATTILDSHGAYRGAMIESCAEFPEGFTSSTGNPDEDLTQLLQAALNRGKELQREWVKFCRDTNRQLEGLNS